MSPPEGRLACPDRDTWLAGALGVAAPVSVPVVQFAARRLPLVALPKWPAVYLSVAVAFALAGAGLFLAARALVRLEDEPERPVAATSVVFLGLVLLVAGFVFACVHDFARPESTLARVLPALAAAALGFGGFLAVSSRGREALASEPSRRFGLELLRFAEVLAAALLATALLLPARRLALIPLAILGTVTSPLAAIMSWRRNIRAEPHDSPRCRIRAYAVAGVLVGTLVAVWLFLAPAL